MLYAIATDVTAGGDIGQAIGGNADIQIGIQQFYDWHDYLYKTIGPIVIGLTVFVAGIGLIIIPRSKGTEAAANVVFHVLGWSALAAVVGLGILIAGG